MSSTTRFLTAALFATVLVPPLQSQAIRGLVLDDSTSLPIAGAEVILRDTLGQTLWVEVTDHSGHFGMRPPPGMCSFEVLRMGYQPVYTEEFEISSGSGDMDLTITLPNAPIILEPATVEGERQPFAPGPLQGFYQRKRRGWGIQLDREEIEAKAPVDVTDVFHNLAGVRVVGRGGRYAEIVMVGAPSIGRSYKASPIPCRIDPSCDPFERTQSSTCEVRYYVDGAKYIPDKKALGINEILVSDVEAVEVYRRASETPAEYLDSDSRCGVIVIWTKRGPGGGTKDR